MAPEYGATCGFFPIDEDTIRYLRDTGRPAELVSLVARLRKSAGHVPHQIEAGPGLYRSPQARTVVGRAVACGTEAPAGPGTAQGGQERLRGRAGQGIRQGRGDGQAGAGGRPLAHGGPRRRGDRGDHLVHQHLEPERDDRGGAPRAQGDRQGPQRQAVGEDFARARLAGSGRVSGQIGLAERPRRARLQSGRLRLHDLHRQFGPAAAGGVQSHQRRRSRRRGRAVRQPQLRGPRQRRRARQLSGFAAACGRLRDRRLDADRRREVAARHRPEGPQGLSARHLADQPRDRRLRAQIHQQTDVLAQIRRRVQGRRELAQDQREGRAHFPVGRRSRPTCRTRRTSPA